MLDSRKYTASLKMVMQRKAGLLARTSLMADCNLVNALQAIRSWQGLYYFFSANYFVEDAATNISMKN